MLIPQIMTFLKYIDNTLNCSFFFLKRHPKSGGIFVTESGLTQSKSRKYFFCKYILFLYDQNPVVTKFNHIVIKYFERVQLTPLHLLIFSIFLKELIHRQLRLKYISCYSYLFILNEAIQHFLHIDTCSQSTIERLEESTTYVQ